MRGYRLRGAHTYEINQLEQPAESGNEAFLLGHLHPNIFILLHPRDPDFPLLSVEIALSAHLS